MFTGRWPHDLVNTWMTPLRGNFPALAEYLGQHGRMPSRSVALFFAGYPSGDSLIVRSLRSSISWTLTRFTSCPKERDIDLVVIR
jgi:hypothetical protein